jgi:hypothetical protein
MTFHVFSFLLLFFLMHSLAWLCRLYLLHHGLAHSKAGAVHPMIQRLLKPRTPHDCPACCLSSPFSTVAGPTPLPVRPWPEVKSRRGAPKRIDTEGFACPNQQCAYFGISDAHIHAAFWLWQAWPGRGHPEVSRSCLPCHVHLQAQHSLVPSENPLTPDRHGALCARLVGSTHPPQSGSSATNKPPSPPGSRALGSTRRRCTRTLSATSSSRTCSWTTAANQIALCHTGLVVVVSYRSLHQDSAGASARSPHTEHGPCGDPLPATEPGPWLLADIHE